jgi:hypothetical protein
LYSSPSSIFFSRILLHLEEAVEFIMNQSEKQWMIK